MIDELVDKAPENTTLASFCCHKCCTERCYMVVMAIQFCAGCVARNEKKHK